VPSEAEWQAEIDAGNWSNASDVFNSALKAVIAGYRRDNNGTYNSGGSHYWSSTAVASPEASYLFDGGIINRDRARAMPIRCIQE
jgi:hypothetical protein